MAIKTRTIVKGMEHDKWIDLINTPKEKRVIGYNNSKLKKSKFYQWSLPAYTASIVRKGKLTTMKTCPQAGSCADACYACQGAFNFTTPMIASSRNLQSYFNEPIQLSNTIIRDIKSLKVIKAFRIHDSGDFFDRNYAMWWMNIVKSIPTVQFYAYTKSVSMFKRFQEQGLIPPNMSIIFSYGGKEDHLIDESKDRHAKVFASHDEMNKAGYADTTEKDDNAANPSIQKIGLVYHGTITTDKALQGRSVM